MLTLFGLLAISGGVATLGGLIWTIFHYSRSEGAGGPTLRQGMRVRRTWATQRGGIRGRYVAAGMSGHVSFAALKAMIAERCWADALPLLVMMVGMMVLILFGALAVLMSAEARLVGVLLVLLALYSIGRILIGLIRA